MRRLVAYLNSLFLGTILGMIFVATMQSPPRAQNTVSTHGILIRYQVIGTNQQKTVLLIAGKVMQLADWPPEFCGRHFDQRYRLSSPIIAISISPIRPAKLQQACALKK